MDKKKIYICIGIIAFMIIVMIVYQVFIKKRSSTQTNVIDQNVVNKPENKEVININTGTVTCTNVNNARNKFVFKVSNDKITHYTLYFSKPKSTFGLDSDATPTQEQKDKIEKSILKDFEINSFTYKGINMSVEYETLDVIITMDVDYTNADLSILNKLGLNFEGSFRTFLSKLLSTKEYTCK